MTQTPDGKQFVPKKLPLTSWGEKERGLLVATLIVFLLLWGVFVLAQAMIGSETENLDRNILLAMRNDIDLDDPLGPPWVEEAGRDITALGSITILTLITVSTALYLAFRQKIMMALVLLLTVASGNVVALILKSIFDRERPTLVSYESFVYTSSFPSGHSMMAAVTYFTLATLLIRVESNNRLKAYYFLLALSLTILVGISRVYLGVHWPSDVLAGWTMGISWALIIDIVIAKLQRSGRLEKA